MSAYEGDVRVFGHRPGRHICIAFVPQRTQVDMSFPATVEDVVMMGRVGKIGLLRWPRKRDWELVRESLDLVDMTRLKNSQIGELSGGQQQRAFIAQALAQEADLILMDEPLTGLDAPSQEKILRILDALKARNITVMVATHDLQQASTKFDRVMLLNKEILAFEKPEVALSTDHLLSAYGDHMHVIDDNAGSVMFIEDKCHDC
jgi:manganese/iron transport system ATP-binding protein